MAIYTSNYARKGNDPGAIAISAGTPDYYIGIKEPYLAPSWDMVNAYKEGGMDEAEYTKQYLHILNGYSFDLYGWLDTLPDPTYFLCFESPGEFCHRRLFAKWAEQRCGWVIPEWLNPKELEEQKQLDVVDNLLTF